uniref:hypothetical protein n=1 Tax=Clostridium lacusfryxellense TaxID=205328 RepID=UPI001FED061A|nr:hypothetical protein [Clostridium lacusfryxellense]
MEPELPFWGTITDENDEKHNQAEQDYLISEGFSILKNFGNHVSFVMMSLGNELWGSQYRMNKILSAYKEFDNRHLYTQGSNNFQFTPVILENDDFFCGVRLSKERLLRGSYAMCDVPLGHVQTDMPSTMKDYDENISGNSNEFTTNIPIISHEIGQYETYPSFNEITKYTGPLKARNFEVFKKRLEEKGLSDLAEKYFKCSGRLAVACYKEELEATFRTRKLAGFQLLDLQDFSGQGTALVGVLDAFMDSKELVSKEEWSNFCSDVVLMARFDKYNYNAEECFNTHVELCYYKNTPLTNLMLLWELKDNDTIYEKGTVQVSKVNKENYIEICDISLKMPAVTSMKKLTLSLEIKEINAEKNYDLWVYPKEIAVDIERSKMEGINIVDSLSQGTIELLEKGQNVLLCPNLSVLESSEIENSIKGVYCVDFWCYPMFRFISQSANKEIPVGTMGLLIDNLHPIFKCFPCAEYSTYQWWSIITNSRSIILDDLPSNFRPIVSTIDNFERNHKMGFLFECNVLNGKLLVCACDFEKTIEYAEGKQFIYSILNYFSSKEFSPNIDISISKLQKILGS